MAIGISTTSNTNWITSTDIYDGQRYYAEQERRYREEMERQRYAAMQQMAYDPNRQAYGGVTDQQRQEAKPAKGRTPSHFVEMHDALRREHREIGGRSRGLARMPARRVVNDGNRALDHARDLAPRAGTPLELGYADDACVRHRRPRSRSPV